MEQLFGGTQNVAAASTQAQKQDIHWRPFCSGRISEVTGDDDPLAVDPQLAARKSFLFQQQHDSLGVVRHVASMVRQVWISASAGGREQDIQSLSAGDEMQLRLDRALLDSQAFINGRSNSETNLSPNRCMMPTMTRRRLAYCQPVKREQHHHEERPTPHTTRRQRHSRRTPGGFHPHLIRPHNRVVSTAAAGWGWCSPYQTVCHRPTTFMAVAWRCFGGPHFAAVSISASSVTVAGTVGKPVRRPSIGGAGERAGARPSSTSGSSQARRRQRRASPRAPPPPARRRRLN